VLIGDSAAPIFGFMGIGGAWAAWALAACRPARPRVPIGVLLEISDKSEPGVVVASEKREMNDSAGRVARVVVERQGALRLYARQWLDAGDDDATAGAEDVVQEALVALLACRPAPRDPVAWMYRAVRNAAIDAARSASRRRRRERHAAATARAEWFDAGAAAETLVDARAAEAALRTLPVELRELVVLRIWGGLGFAQIAEVTTLGVATVHERYKSALARLRGALEKPCDRKTATNTKSD
jgi:RNA polymerase sigma factor (sigma-70 family)